MPRSPLTPHREAIRAIPPERFLVIEGQKIHVTDSGGDGAPLLLIHGLTASHYSFRRLAPLFEKAGRRVVTIDLNGFGLTERPRNPDHYRLEHQADLIARVLDSHAIDHCDVLGHSYGAAVAATLAKQHPDRCGRLVFVSPAGVFNRLPWYLRNSLGRSLLLFPVRRAISDPRRYQRIASRAFHVPGSFTEVDSEIYRSYLLIEGLPWAWHGFLRSMRDPRFPASAYDDLFLPVLILAGAEDKIVPLAKCEALHASLRRATLDVIPDCGHSAPEERPEVVAEKSLRFLGGLSG